MAAHAIYVFFLWCITTDAVSVKKYVFFKDDVLSDGNVDCGDCDVCFGLVVVEVDAGGGGGACGASVNCRKDSARLVLVQIGRID